MRQVLHYSCMEWVKNSWLSGLWYFVKPHAIVSINTITNVYKNFTPSLTMKSSSTQVCRCDQSIYIYIPLIVITRVSPVRQRRHRRHNHLKLHYMLEYELSGRFISLYWSRLREQQRSVWRIPRMQCVSIFINICHTNTNMFWTCMDFLHILAVSFILL